MTSTEQWPMKLTCMLQKEKRDAFEMKMTNLVC